MKIQMLPSTIDSNGRASLRQHLLSIVVDDRVAIDAGCLALACSDVQRDQVRDIVLTHTHLDHIAGLPMFIDDLFSALTEPLRIHATHEMVEILERDVFNWAIYPRFSELSNDHGPVVEYCEFERGASFQVAHLRVRSVAVNHKVSASGYIVSDGDGHVVITGDTAETDEIWEIANELTNIKAVLVECAFPDELGELAHVSNHLTPGRLATELAKLSSRNYPVHVINIKPTYRQRVIDQITSLGLQDVHILEIGKVYQF
jgi:ribonuclease BN (tRNA processing enzyme)